MALGEKNITQEPRYLYLSHPNCHNPVKSRRSSRRAPTPHHGRILPVSKGEASMTVGKEQITCGSGDFISIPANTLHSLKAITDIEIITIGCAIH